MTNSCCPINSSLGKKFTIAATGLGLYLFVLIHLVGNLQCFLGPEATNAYAYKLKSMPHVLWPARLGLLAFFALHIFTGIRLALENRAARPQGYAKKNTVQATIASRTMVQTGVMILLFVIFHLMHFTLFTIHPEWAELHDDKLRHDVYSMMILGFSNPWVSAVYIAAMFFLAVHLRQAFSGMFQTFGLADGRRLDMLKKVSLAFSIVIFVGYVSMPIAVLAGVLK